MIGYGGSVSDPFKINDLRPSGLANGYTDLTNKVQVSPLLAAERTCVLLLAGQSNIGNSGQGGSFTPIHSKVHNLNIFNGGIYQAVDPLLGCDGAFSCMGTQLGDTLITDNKYDRVILVPFAIGATTIAQWATGGVCNSRIGVAARRLASLGLTSTFVLWQQGESDKIAGTSQSAYTAGLLDVIGNFRSLGITCPFFVSKTSYAASATSTAVQNAQAAVVDNVSVFAGPNTDSLNNSYRTAGTDFTYAGMTAVAALWAPIIEAH